MIRFAIINGERVLLKPDTPATRQAADKPRASLPVSQKPPMKKGLYAIVDTITADLVGNMNCVTVHKGDTPAIRFFNEVAREPQTHVRQHINDMVFVRLGWLSDETNEVTPDFEILLTGQRWMAAQESKPE